jgi:4-hydroxybenzoate polyprenyltransferase
MGFKKFSQLVMIEQTLFSLPFAYLGVLFAGGASVTVWVWVTVALVAARTAGMAFNRAIDAEIDAKNPRTAGRLVPSGEIQKLNVWLIGIVASLVLIVAAYVLNPLCFGLSFLAVGMLVTYSYFKRFSASSHFYLGMVEAAAPIGGYLAVTGELTWIPFVLGFVIMMWIAGLDIVYALQDEEFDAREKLHSIPVRLGRTRALTLSAICYALAMGALVLAGVHTDMAVPYWIGIALVGWIFAYQQGVARSKQVAMATRKFFRANMYVSPVLLSGTFFAVVVM